MARTLADALNAALASLGWTAAVGLADVWCRGGEHVVFRSDPIADRIIVTVYDGAVERRHGRISGYVIDSGDFVCFRKALEPILNPVVGESFGLASGAALALKNELPRVGDVCRMRNGYEGNTGAKMFIITSIVHDGSSWNYLYEINGKVHGAFASWLEVVERRNPGADPPTRITSTPAVADVERVVQRAVEKVVERAPRRHNATCPRCYGPAYHGFGYAPTCEREGGCLADKDPTEDDIQPSLHSRCREGGWRMHFGNGSASGAYATRDQAVAAWREVVLERAKREAGR